MTEHIIPAANWSDVLAIALRAAAPGDTIIVRTEPMRLLAESAAERMGKTGLTITVAEDDITAPGGVFVMGADPETEAHLRSIVGG